MVFVANYSTGLSISLQRVVINGTSSDWDKVDYGVPQGTVLGPLLLLLYINDIADDLQSDIRHFADDCIWYKVVNNTTDCVKLQDDIDQLDRWDRKWQMQFNAKNVMS